MIVLRCNLPQPMRHADRLRYDRFRMALMEADAFGGVPEGLERPVGELLDRNGCLIGTKPRADALLAWLATLPGWPPSARSRMPLVVAAQAKYDV